jgi:hypothetical protein
LPQTGNQEIAGRRDPKRGHGYAAGNYRIEETIMAAEKPIHTVRLGRIKAAIWANETQVGTRHNVRLCRLYKDGDDWKQSESFGRDDLPLVAKVVDMAHTWIFEQPQDPR